MWNKFSEIKKKAVEGLNSATSMATQLAKEIIKENLEGPADDTQVDDQVGEDQKKGNSDDSLQNNHDDDQKKVAGTESSSHQLKEGEFKIEAGLDNQASTLNDGPTVPKKSDDHSTIGVEESANQSLEGLASNDGQYRGQTSTTESSKMDSHNATDSSQSNLNQDVELEAQNESNRVQNNSTDDKEVSTEGKSEAKHKIDSMESYTGKPTAVESSENLNRGVSGAQPQDRSSEQNEFTAAHVNTIEVKDDAESQPLDETRSKMPGHEHASIEGDNQGTFRSTNSNQPSNSSSIQITNLIHKDQDGLEGSKAEFDPQISSRLGAIDLNLSLPHQPTHVSTVQPSCSEHIQVIDKLTKEKASLLDDICTLNTQLVDLKTTHGEVSSKLKASEAHIQALSSQLADTKKQFNSALAKKDKEINLLNEEAGLYKERIKTLQAWYDEMAKKEKEKDQDRIKKDKERGDKDKLEKEKLIKDLERLQSEIADSRTTIGKLEEDKQSLRMEILKAKEAAERIQEISDNAEEEKSTLEDELRKTKKVVDELRKEREKGLKEESSLKRLLEEARENEAKSRYALQEKEKDWLLVAEERERLKKEAVELIEQVKIESQQSSVNLDHMVAYSKQDRQRSHWKLPGKLLREFFESQSSVGTIDHSIQDAQLFS
jgi:hypothetical protein